MTQPPLLPCPVCKMKGLEVRQEEVDIGVGTQMGPCETYCEGCGFVLHGPTLEVFKACLSRPTPAALQEGERLTPAPAPVAELTREQIEAKLADSLADRLEWALKLLKTPVLYLGKPEELDFIERALQAHAKHRIESGLEDKRGLL